MPLNLLESMAFPITAGDFIESKKRERRPSTMHEILFY